MRAPRPRPAERGTRLPLTEVPPEEHPDVLALMARARKSESASTPRKHHLVPASYLKRWAEGGKIRVSDVNAGRTYITAPEKAARETDYYRVQSEDIDPEFLPPLFLETFLSHIEDLGKQAIDGPTPTTCPRYRTRALRSVRTLHGAPAHPRALVSGGAAQAR